MSKNTRKITSFFQKQFPHASRTAHLISQSPKSLDIVTVNKPDTTISTTPNILKDSSEAVIGRVEQNRSFITTSNQILKQTPAGSVLSNNQQNSTCLAAAAHTSHSQVGVVRPPSDKENRPVLVAAKKQAPPSCAHPLLPVKQSIYSKEERDARRRYRENSHKVDAIISAIAQHLGESEVRKIEVSTSDPPTASSTSESGSGGSMGDSPVKTKKRKLSTEQKKKMEENRKLAKAKLKVRAEGGGNISGASGGHPNLTSPMLANLSPGWMRALTPQFTMPYFTELIEFLELDRSRHTIYPPPEQVFTWARVCDVSEVKVVIIGQDPYHNPNQAHGLSFSVQKGVRPPPSLLNMYKELTNDIPGFKAPDHGDLTGWAQQGVLLLNAVLTVRCNQPNSHTGRGWESLTGATIQWLADNLSHLVFILWGNYAKKKGSGIDQNQHLVLTSAHPSPLSVRHGFFGSRPFSRANEYLQRHGKQAIDWTRLP